ncbi:MAG: hypothetical protein M1827_007048 [Pycnora praestabilis]|nr:MAG: hypothetical protein M1827_007048 [Pycnora praestabilis]
MPFKDPADKGKPDDTAHIIERLEKLELRIKAVDHNNLARLKNSRLKGDSYKLDELHDVHTNTPIKAFPGKEKDIRLMSPAEVKTILTALDTDLSGTPAERKTRLRVHIGLSASPTKAAAGAPAKPPTASPKAASTANGVAEDGANAPEKNTPASTTTPETKKPTFGLKAALERKEIRDAQKKKDAETAAKKKAEEEEGKEADGIDGEAKDAPNGVKKTPPPPPPTKKLPEKKTPTTSANGVGAVKKS